MNRTVRPSARVLRAATGSHPRPRRRIAWGCHGTSRGGSRRGIRTATVWPSPNRITRGSPQKPEAGFDPARPLVVPRSCFSSGSFQSPCGQSRSSDGGSRPGLVEASPDRSCGRLKGCQVSTRSLVGRVEADRCVKRSSDHIKGEAEFGLGDCQPLGELAIDSV